MTIELIDEAVQSGARQHVTCRELSLDSRTVQRWRKRDGGEDLRCGPKTKPANKLSAAERKEVLRVADSAEFRDISPKQLVPRLADQGQYLASESTFYRILREEKQLAHRGRQRPPSPSSPREHCAVGPCQLWSWDITYLRAPIKGMFFYLYMFVDVWSRKIVGYEVHDTEDGTHASRLLAQSLRAEEIDGAGLVLHQDNGSPMKGSTFRATMDRLGITPSFSRPHVSDDNAYSESLFRTLKHCPKYPTKPFASLEDARKWVKQFVDWYNNVHLHSAIGFVTPSDRHHGSDDEILKLRRAVYEQARNNHPERWNGRSVRAWDKPGEVWLNPSKERDVARCK